MGADINGELSKGCERVEFDWEGWMGVSESKGRWVQGKKGELCKGEGPWRGMEGCVSWLVGRGEG